LEYFDSESLGFLRQKYPTIPDAAIGAVFFRTGTAVENEEQLMTEWLGLLERHHALADESWFATNDQDQAKAARVPACAPGPDERMVRRAINSAKSRPTLAVP